MRVKTDAHGGENEAGSAMADASEKSDAAALGDGIEGDSCARGWHKRSASVRNAVRNGTPALGCVARWTICRWINAAEIAPLPYSTRNGSAASVIAPLTTGFERGSRNAQRSVSSRIGLPNPTRDTQPDSHAGAVGDKRVLHAADIEPGRMTPSVRQIES